MEGLGNTEEVKAIRKRAIRAGLKLVDCPIRHLGTEKAQELYYAIEQHLLKNGILAEGPDLILERPGPAHQLGLVQHAVHRLHDLVAHPLTSPSPTPRR